MKRVNILLLVLVGMFFISVTSALPEYVFEEAANYYVYDCTELNESGVYYLNQSVTSEGTCFNITADDVVLDGNGERIYSLSENSGAAGVHATGETTLVFSTLES